MCPSRDKGGEFDEVCFRELLASMFPSKFADEQVEKAKHRKRMRGRRSSKGKAKKVAKDTNDSDASSRASYEDVSDSSEVSDASSSVSSTDGEQDGDHNPVEPSLQLWKVENGKVVMVPLADKKHKRQTGDSKNPVDSAIQSTLQDIVNTARKRKYKNQLQEETDEDEDSCSFDEEDEDEDDSEYQPDEDEDEDDEDEDDEDEEGDDDDEDDDEREQDSDESVTLEISEISPRSSVESPDGQVAVRRSERIRMRQVKTPAISNKKRPRMASNESENDTLNDAFLRNTLDKVPKAIKTKCEQHWRRFKEHVEKERVAYEQKKKKNEKKEKRKNLIEFKKLLREGSNMDDLRYFNRVLGVDEQKRLMRQIEEVKSHYHNDVPYRLRLLDSPIPPKTKAVALRKINSLHKTSPGDGEYHKLKKWVDAFMRMPFGKFSELSMTLSDGKEKCHEFMINAKRTLDETVFGLDDAKLQIMQMLGQWISNPAAIGSSLAIHGPMGTGKTTLVKEGISKILGREFVFIALGGATDSSFLEGHSYTYEGSTWGKIIDCIMQCKTMNPIIYFDELDKVSDSARGEEIIGILTHLTDTSQNDKFHDKYFSEVEFDLSKCLFIFSYNDPDRVNPILRDRMYTIKTNGYSVAEKVTIAKDYLLPTLIPQVGFSVSDVTVPEETIQFITREYTDTDEKGVRSLKRCLEIILTKLNLFRLLNPGTVMFGQTVPENVEFPVTVTESLVQTLLKKKETDNKHWVMYS